MRTIRSETLPAYWSRSLQFWVITGNVHVLHRSPKRNGQSRGPPLHVERGFNAGQKRGDG
jgi:hypothetical protein